MSEYSIEVRITPRAGLLDPQGKAVTSALHSLDFAEVSEVRIGRLLRLRMQAESEAAAKARVDAMCKQLLANPVTEDYAISIEATA